MDKTNKSSFVETVDAVDNTDVKFVDLNTQIDDKYNTDKYKNNKIPINISKFDYSINGDELFLIGDSFLDLKGLVSHHLESANNFYLNGIKQIITQGFKIEKKIINRRNITPEDKEIDWIHCEVIPTDVQLKSPTTLRFLTGAETMLFPKNALIREKNYSGTLYISCIAKKTAHYKNGTERTETDELKLFRISKIKIEDKDFNQGSLKRESFVRIDKIGSIEKSLIKYKIGSLKPEKFKEIISHLIKKLIR